MDRPIIEQVFATHNTDWKKWPDTEDRDYSAILAQRTSCVLHTEQGEVELVMRLFPVYYPQAALGYLQTCLLYPGIDNRTDPAPALVQKTLELLRAQAQGAEMLTWFAAHQCWPSVAKELPSMFKLRVLNHGDDCTMSTPPRTIPVAPYFTVLAHWMQVYDVSTGERVPEVYARHGLHHCYHSGASLTPGTTALLADSPNFSVAKKAAALRAGTLPQTDFIWVGTANGWGGRLQTAQSLNTMQWPPGCKTKILGYGMRDGILLPAHDHPHPKGLSYPAAELYVDSLTGANAALSSLFNLRLWDLWGCGVVQVAYDPHGELDDAGFIDGEHYFSVDTYEEIPAVVERMKANPALAADVILAAHEKANAYIETHDNLATTTRIVGDYLKGTFK